MRPFCHLALFLCFAASALVARADEIRLIYPDGNSEPGVPEDIERFVGREVRVVTSHGPEAAPPARKPLREPAAESTVYLRYDAAYRTAHYKCWGPTGLSDQWQGVTVDDVCNAGVVRRGTTVRLAGDQPFTLEALDDLRILSPAPPDRARTRVLNWPTSLSAGELLITIPDEAPVGDYLFHVGDDYCTAYVIFDPHPILDHGHLGAEGFASWAYDDDPFPYTAHDYVNHVVYGPGPSTDWDPLTSERLYAFKGGEDDRDQGVFGQRLVELAASIHGRGAASPEQAGAHIYAVVGQRMEWTDGGSFGGLSSGYENTFDRVFNGEGVRASGETHTADELPVEVAERAALGRGRIDPLPPDFVIAFGQCMNFAGNTAALARAIGIPSRVCYTKGTTGWYRSFHVWAELCIPDSRFTPPGWTNVWWKFDSADPYDSDINVHQEGAITPLRMDGWIDFVCNALNQPDCDLQGGQFLGAWSANVALCDQPANHSSVRLKPATIEAPTPTGSMIWYHYDDPDCPWQVVDSWSPPQGTGAPGRSFVATEAHGYALNERMNLADGGAPVIANATSDDDLPQLLPGRETWGVLGGLGVVYYRVDLAGLSALELRVQQTGSESGFGVRLFASIDDLPFVDGTDPFGDYESIDDVLSLSTIPPDAERLLVMAAGFDDGERLGNQTWTPFSLLLESPDVAFTHISPTHGEYVSRDVTISALAEGGSLQYARILIDGVEAATWTPPSPVTQLSIEYPWDVSALTPWSHHLIEFRAGSGSAAATRRVEVIVADHGTVYFEDFEAGAPERWDVLQRTPETTGAWIAGRPYEAITGPPHDRRITQPGRAAEGIQCLFTAQNEDGSAASDDVDDGWVSATSRRIPLPAGEDLRLHYDRWWFNRDVGEDAEDAFYCEVQPIENGGWMPVEQLASEDPSTSWTTRAFDLRAIAPDADSIRIRFTASDGPARGNLIEAAIDNIRITGSPAPPDDATAVKTFWDY